MFNTRLQRCLTLFGLPLLALHATAAQADTLCPAPSLVHNSNQMLTSADEGLAVEADNATLGNDGITILQGNVAMQRDEGVLRAEELLYDQENQRVSARKNVSFTSGELEVLGEAAQVDLLANTAEFEQTQFSVVGQGARGSAGNISIAGDGSPDMREVSYTTCPPGNDSWELRADRIRLNQDSGQGKANNVSLRFKGVPIFYFPYLQFPFTDQRQSGLLAPIFGSSGSNGVSFGIPYYWNIAPNMDATFTPSFLSSRGWRLDSEYRAITGTPFALRNTQAWWQGDLNVHVDWLPNDQKEHQSRHLTDVEGTLKGRGEAHYWRWQNKLVNVSDNEWLNDFGNSLADVSQPFYVSRSEADWHYHSASRDLSFKAVAEDHNPLANTNTTLVSRKPAIYFSVTQQLGNSPFAFGVDSQAGRFAEHGSNSTTLRYHYQPWLGYEYNHDGLWATVRAEFLSTRWSTQTPGQNDVIEERRLPLYNAAIGLHLEKAFDNGHHVIEPQLAFRAAPFRDQSAIPVLDTHSETLYWHNLDDDQFSGLDRIRDGQQISGIIASRWYNHAGQERLGIRVGQRWYLEDSQVTLPGETPLVERSNTLFELNAALGQRWYLSTSGEWDSQLREIEHSQVRVDLKDRQLGDFYLALRTRRDLFQQLSLGAKRQISSHWYTDINSLYSLDDSEILEADVSMRYQTCCWAVDFGGRRILRDSNGEPDVGFFIQLELSGLTQLGSQ